MKDPASLLPEVVYVTADAVADPLVKRVTSRLGMQPVLCDTAQLPMSEPGLSPAARYTAAKRLLLITRYQGAWLKGCPGTNQHVCCNLWVVNPGEGCPMDCTYCYLQSYLCANPIPKLFSNTEEMCSAITARTRAEPGRFFRICTGELTDSLVWDELTDLSLELVPLFAALPNAVLELKTKTTAIGNLVNLEREHCGKTVVSWSVNAQKVCDEDEAGAATLDKRLIAAQTVSQLGYRVGFHFDPVVHFPGWEDGYRDVIRRIFSMVSPSAVAWISISALRYRREMQQMMQERFPESLLPFGEQFLAVDNKLRYIQPLRFKMINFLWKELKSASPALPVYMCMESAAAWRHVTGGPPAAGSELGEVFARSAKF